MKRIKTKYRNTRKPTCWDSFLFYHVLIFLLNHINILFDHSYDTKKIEKKNTGTTIADYWENMPRWFNVNIYLLKVFFFLYPLKSLDKGLIWHNKRTQSNNFADRFWSLSTHMILLNRIDQWRNQTKYFLYRMFQLFFHCRMPSNNLVS